jgi:polysaccharide export outer membrane protein
MSMLCRRTLILSLCATTLLAGGPAGCEHIHGPAAPLARGQSAAPVGKEQAGGPRPAGDYLPPPIVPAAHAPPVELPPPAAAPGGPCGHDPGPLPRELVPASHPPYTVAPPDILYIDAIRLIPRPPYRVEPLEQLQIQATETLPGQPISGIYTVSPEGTVNLGFTYGSVRVAGLTLDQVQTAIQTHLGKIVRNPQVVVSLVQFRGMQQTIGQHLVRQDGTISLGTYGSVYVAGLTLGQLKAVLESHLSKYFLNPVISVDVAAYNSKFYYVITDGGGFGQLVYKFPVTGNETVLDAIANIQGLPPVASKRRIWVARPAPPDRCCYQVLPVDWNAITQGGQTTTNYQLFPGDRVYVAADKLIAFDNWLSKIFAPIERVLGVTLLGASTVRTITDNNNTGFIGFVP